MKYEHEFWASCGDSQQYERVRTDLEWCAYRDRCQDSLFKKLEHIKTTKLEYEKEVRAVAAEFQVGPDRYRVDLNLEGHYEIRRRTDIGCTPIYKVVEDSKADTSLEGALKRYLARSGR